MKKFLVSLAFLFLSACGGGSDAPAADQPTSHAAAVTPAQTACQAPGSTASSGVITLAPGKTMECRWIAGKSLSFSVRQLAVPPVAAGVGGYWYAGTAAGRAAPVYKLETSVTQVRSNTAPAPMGPILCSPPVTVGGYCGRKLVAGVNGFVVSGVVVR